jgi:hypothetical protein
MWVDYMHNLSGGEHWRAAKLSNPSAGATLEALTDREGKEANTIAEKKEMFQAESFPVNDGDLYYTRPPAGHAYKRINELSVECALFSLSG